MRVVFPFVLCFALIVFLVVFWWKTLSEHMKREEEQRTTGIKRFKTFSEFYVAKFTGCCHIDEIKATYWAVESRRSRLDGPAIVYDYGGYVWMVDEQYHRLDGPAVHCAISGYIQYYLYGVYFHKEEDYWNHPVVQRVNAKQKLERICNFICE